MTDPTQPRRVSRRVRFEVLRRDNHACRYCGATAPDARLTVDHVMPQALGGSDDPTNLVTACDPCNSGKASVAPDAPLVADVAADALRWAAARRAVIDQWRQDEWEAIEAEDGVMMTAGDLGRGVGVHVADILPRDFRTTVRAFLRAGLEGDDIERMLHIAADKHSLPPRSWWRYACGIAWRTLEQLDASTAAAVSAQDGGQ